MERFNYKGLGKRHGELYHLIWNRENGERWHIMSSYKRREITSMYNRLGFIIEQIEIK